MVALQLQDIVRQQATTIESLECRLNEMEKRVHEGTELYLDIHQANIENFSKMKSRLHYQKCYNKRLKALQKSHIKENNELKQKIDALTEWCSQPLWKRTSAFVFPKESMDEIISEF
jgi:lipoate synthase